jgi:hypothetical protein
MSGDGMRRLIHVSNVDKALLKLGKTLIVVETVINMLFHACGQTFPGFSHHGHITCAMGNVLRA